MNPFRILYSNVYRFSKKYWHSNFYIIIDDLFDFIVHSIFSLLEWNLEVSDSLYLTQIERNFCRENNRSKIKLLAPNLSIPILPNLIRFNMKNSNISAINFFLDGCFGDDRVYFSHSFGYLRELQFNLFFFRSSLTILPQEFDKEWSIL